MKCLVFLGSLLVAGLGFAANGLASISDVRVAPLLQSRWGQKLDTGYDNVGDYCFNYCTPDHDPCGCSATGFVIGGRGVGRATAKGIKGASPLNAIVTIASE